MRERITAILTWIRETWDKATRRARLIFLGSIAGVLVVALVLTILLNHKTYVTLYNDLTATENAQVIAVLNEGGIAYEVDNGRLLVEEKDEEKARLQLAVLGFEDAGFKYDLAQSGGLTATQEDKTRNALFNLQERLASTIQLFPEVSRAVVTISMPERTLFALQTDNTPPSANITIQKKAGRNLTSEQVRGIINIVRDSVPGLTDDKISIVDEKGDLKYTLDLNEDYNNKKLDLTEQVNRSLRDHIMTILQPSYGVGNVEVAVYATLNTDSHVQEQTTYQPIDPENPSNNPIDYSEYDVTKDGTLAAAEGVPGAQDNVGTPQYDAMVTDAEGATYYSGHRITDYLVSSLREQIVKDGFTITGAKVAVLINNGSLADGERDAVIALAANASGIDSTNITVQNMKFFVPEEELGITGLTPTQILIISGLGLLLLCILLIIVLTILSRRRKARLAAEAAAAMEEDQLSLTDLMATDEDFEPISLVETPEQKLKLQIKDLAESDPEIVAQLIKTWLMDN